MEFCELLSSTYGPPNCGKSSGISLFCWVWDKSSICSSVWLKTSVSELEFGGMWMNAIWEDTVWVGWTVAWGTDWWEVDSSVVGCTVATVAVRVDTFGVLVVRCKAGATASGRILAVGVDFADSGCGWTEWRTGFDVAWDVWTEAVDTPIVVEVDCIGGWVGFCCLVLRLSICLLASDNSFSNRMVLASYWDLIDAILRPFSSDDCSNCLIFSLSPSIDFSSDSFSFRILCFSPEIAANLCFAWYAIFLALSSFSRAAALAVSLSSVTWFKSVFDLSICCSNCLIFELNSSIFCRSSADWDSLVVAPTATVVPLFSLSLSNWILSSSNCILYFLATLRNWTIVFWFVVFSALKLFNSSDNFLDSVVFVSKLFLNDCICVSRILRLFFWVSSSWLNLFNSWVEFAIYFQMKKWLKSLINSYECVGPVVEV